MAGVLGACWGLAVVEVCSSAGLLPVAEQSHIPAQPEPEATHLWGGWGPGLLEPCGGQACEAGAQTAQTTWKS